MIQLSRSNIRVQVLAVDIEDVGARAVEQHQLPVVVRLEIVVVQSEILD